MKCGLDETEDFHLDGIEDLPIKNRDLASDTYVRDSAFDRKFYPKESRKEPKPTMPIDPVSILRSKAHILRMGRSLPGPAARIIEDYARFTCERIATDRPQDRQYNARDLLKKAADSRKKRRTEQTESLRAEVKQGSRLSLGMKRLYFDEQHRYEGDLKSAQGDPAALMKVNADHAKRMQVLRERR
jgi:hypothetical protein